MKNYDYLSCLNAAKWYNSVKNSDNLPCLGLVKTGLALYTITFTLPDRPLKFIRYCLTQRIWKPMGSFEIRWVRQCLVNVVWFGIKHMQTSEMTVNPQSNFYVGPVNVFPGLWHYESIHIFLHLRKKKSAHTGLIINNYQGCVIMRLFNTYIQTACIFSVNNQQTTQKQTCYLTYVTSPYACLCHSYCHQVFPPFLYQWYLPKNCVHPLRLTNLVGDYFSEKGYFW